MTLPLVPSLVSAVRSCAATAESPVARSDAGVVRYRSFRLDAPQVADDGTIQIIGSTDAPVQVDADGTREILSHDPAAVDISATHSLLLNHDAAWIAGPVHDVQFAGGQSAIVAQIHPDARTASGLSVLEAVRTRALRGVSIGYVYDPRDAVFDPDTRTITVSRWRMLEVTLTPIPVDAAAMVRSYAGLRDIPTRMHTRSPADHNPPEVSTMDPEDHNPQDDAGTTTTERSEHTDDVRAMIREEIRAALAESRESADEHDEHGERAAYDAGGDGDGERSADGLVSKRELDAHLREMRHLVQHQAAAQRSAPTTPTRVIRDEADNIRDQAVDDLLKGRSVSQVVRNYAIRHGIRSAGTWGQGNVVDFFFSRAAETSANFSQVTALASKKAMQKGYDSYEPWSDVVLDKDTTGDFKTFRVGGLQMGDLAEQVAEGDAFTDMTIDDGGGSGVLTFRGRGLELTKQAIYNDEMGQFFKKLSKIGNVARRHQDISFNTALEAASFTAASLGTAALSATSLNAAWAAFVVFTGPAGTKTGLRPKYLVVPPALAADAHALVTITTGTATDPGLSRNSAFPLSPLQVVVNLDATDTTDWYLAADPAQAAGFTWLTHTDYPIPQVFEVDAGFAPNRKFRIEYPAAVIASTSGAGKPVGWGKAAVA